MSLIISSHIYVLDLCLSVLASLSVNNANPPLPVVQRFVHLLDFSDVDYAEEIGMMIALMINIWKMSPIFNEYSLCSIITKILRKL